MPYNFNKRQDVIMFTQALSNLLIELRKMLVQTERTRVYSGDERVVRMQQRIHTNMFLQNLLGWMSRMNEELLAGGLENLMLVPRATDTYEELVSCAKQYTDEIKGLIGHL